MSANLFDRRRSSRYKTFKHGGLSGAYCETGDPKGQPLIILHGLTGNHIGMLPLANSLKKFRCILPDVPGHGATPIPGQQATPQHVTSWFRAFVAKWDNPVVIAHSYGGSLALAALTDRPSLVTGCILMNPVAKTSRLAQGYRYLGTVIPSAVGSFLNDVSTVRRHRHRYLLVRHEPVVYRRLEQLKTAESALRTTASQIVYFRMLGVYFDNPAIFANIPKNLAQKTYCIVASRDPIVSGDNNSILRGRFGKKHVITCAKSGHLMPVEATGDTAKIINKILSNTPVLAAKPTTVV